MVENKDGEVKIYLSQLQNVLIVRIAKTKCKNIT